MKKKVSIFWHRRDLRLHDNMGLYEALKNSSAVQPIFIFDKEILDKLEEKDDRRVHFIHTYLERINKELKEYGASIQTFHDSPLDAFRKLVDEYEIEAVYTNRDYEPYARERDGIILKFLSDHGIGFHTYKDHVIFEPNEVLKDDGNPYTVYTPYSKKWMKVLEENPIKTVDTKPLFKNFNQDTSHTVIQLAKMGFEPSDGNFPEHEVSDELLKAYGDKRDIPSVRGTSRLSVHLRFGTVSIRELSLRGKEISFKWLNELIWRNFYQMIIWHYPRVVNEAFKKQYDNIPWRNNEKEFEAWCKGKTGYPIVDAGMRELNKTGFMHNRVRMITASFLTKHLLIDWRWGEAYFAKKLLDYELASNNGGWQWAASSGCDAAPYFRVFNPELQTKKFDPKLAYIKKWVPEFQELTYSKPIVEHKFARERVLETFKSALN